MSKFQIIALFISLLWLLMIFELVRRRKLNGAYSLVWLLSGIVLVVFALWENLLLKLTHLLGLVYPPSTFFAVVIIFLTIILLDFSVRLSKISREHKELAQKMTLLRLKKKDEQKSR